MDRVLCINSLLFSTSKTPLKSVCVLAATGTNVKALLEMLPAGSQFTLRSCLIVLEQTCLSTDPTVWVAYIGGMLCTFVFLL